MAKKRIVLCDSNILFRYFKGDELMNQELNALGFERLALSVISEAEMYAGMKKGEKRKTTQTIHKFDIIEIDTEISRRFARLVFEHYDKRPSLPDLLIASTALVYQYDIFTFNKKDFNFIEGISFYQPIHQHEPYR